MLKKMALCAALVLSTQAFADHGPSGCGLGAMLFKGKEGLVFNVLAATFNGSSGNQTFAMSTGTLGCEDAKDAEVTGPVFIQNNREKLANDISRGQGETLEAYLTLIGKQSTDKNLLKKNFTKLFAADNDAQSIHSQITELI